MAQIGADAPIEPLSPSYAISAVPPEHLDDVWAQLEPMIKRGLEQGQGDDTTSDALKASVRSEGRQLWVATENTEIVAGMVLEVLQRPARRVVFIQMLAGRDMSGWFEKGFAMIERFRVLNGADTIEASCRAGMAKLLERHGWARKAVIMQAPK